MNYSPFEQFEVNLLAKFKLLGLDLSLTNLLSFLILAHVILIFFLTAIEKNKKFVPSYWRALVETIYLFIVGLVKEQSGKKDIHLSTFCRSENNPVSKNSAWIILLFINGDSSYINYFAIAGLALYILYNYEAIKRYLLTYRGHYLISDFINFVMLILLLLIFYLPEFKESNIFYYVLIALAALLFLLQAVYSSQLTSFVTLHIAVSSIITLIVFWGLIFLKCKKLLFLSLGVGHSAIAVFISVLFAWTFTRLLLSHWLHVGKNIAEININIMCMSYIILIRLFFFEKIISLKAFAGVIFCIPMFFFYAFLVRKIYQLIFKFLLDKKVILQRPDAIKQITSFYRQYYYFNYKIFFYLKKLDSNKLISVILYSFMFICLTSLNIDVYHNILLLLLIINFYLRYNFARIIRYDYILVGVKSTIEERLPMNHLDMMTMLEAVKAAEEKVAAAAAAGAAQQGGMPAGIPQGGNPYGHQPPQPPYPMDEKSPEMAKDSNQSDNNSGNDTNGSRFESDLIGPATFLAIAATDHIITAAHRQEDELKEIVQKSEDKGLELKQENLGFERKIAQERRAADLDPSEEGKRYHNAQADSYEKSHALNNQYISKTAERGEQAKQALDATWRNNLDSTYPPVDEHPFDDAGGLFTS